MKFLAAALFLILTPLAWSSDIFSAIDASNLKGVQDILESGNLDPDARHKGWTPMTYAAAKGEMQMVELFLENGVDINEKGRKNWTALTGASRSGHGKLAKMLLERGADPNVEVKGSGYTALLTAIAHEHVEIALMILEKDVDVNIINNTGWTPLMAAARRGQTKVVARLLEKGAKPNKGATSDGRGGWRGNTALYESAARGYLDVVKLLVEHGGDFYLHPNGRSPYKAAKKRKHKEVAAYLMSVHEQRYGKKKYRMLK